LDQKTKRNVLDRLETRAAAASQKSNLFKNVHVVGVVHFRDTAGHFELGRRAAQNAGERGANNAKSVTASHSATAENRNAPENRFDVNGRRRTIDIAFGAENFFRTKILQSALQ
jgi:hypothetical protein